jgi:uncharacterized protein
MYKFFFIFAILAQSLVAKEESQILKVTGSGQVFIQASLADIRIGIEVEGKNSAAVQNDLASKLNRLTNGLKKEKLDKLETTSLSVFPLYTERQPTEIRGYRGNGEVLMTVPILRAGEMISLAKDLGATKINSMELRGSEDEVGTGRKAALQKALENAMQSAKVALNTLHLELKEIFRINLNPEPPQPKPWRAQSFAAKSIEASANPEIMGEQMIQAEVVLELSFREKDVHDVH